MNRRTSQTLAILATIAAVGEFLIGFRTLFGDGSPAEPKPEFTQQVQTTGQADCNLQPYEPRLERERKRINESSEKEQDILLKLGEDYNYRYFYDYKLDQAFCRPIENPTAKRISSEPTSGQKMDELVLFWAAVVAAVSAAGLVLIQLFRTGE